MDLMAVQHSTAERLKTICSRLARIVPVWMLVCSAPVMAAETSPSASGEKGKSMNALVGIEPPHSPKRLDQKTPEGHVSLGGTWAFRKDPDNRGEKEAWHRPDAGGKWDEIVVPGVWQTQGFGLDYHGVGWYRRSITLPTKWEGRQLWVTFHGASTKATVWLNGSRLGEHVGNWAPFTLNLSAAWKARCDNVLVVRVEEMPGHFSAGFAREMGRLAGGDSHFGGLWQDVTMFETGDVRLDDVFIVPRLAERNARVRLELSSRTTAPTKVIVTVADPAGKVVSRREEQVASQSVDAATSATIRKADLTLDIPNPSVWSPQSPSLYTASVEAFVGDQLSDRRSMRFGMRSVERKGTQILLNGEPLMVRGVLHWGYYPDLLNIDPSEERIRQEFRELRASGFNLVKVCLFVFPQRFYDIADETGMLLWQEYPTWLHARFPQAGDTSLDADFAREYPEWFRLDRSRTSIILRDLTCEAHNNPNWDLLERTYRTGKELLDGALLCDNSSFFMHRITDWYVCHTYRDLDEYYQYFPELVCEMRAKPEKKPFLFGEDFDADTWRDSEAIASRFMSKGTPWWLKNVNFEGQLQFDEKLRAGYGPDAPKRLVAMQNRHAFALRKAYIEEFRRYPEPAGFVMTSLRDNPGTRPGFYDDLLQPKWTPEQWKPFNSDGVLMFDSPRRSRCYRADETITATLEFSNYGADLNAAPLTWRLLHDGRERISGRGEVTVRRGEIHIVAQLEIKLPKDLAETTSPVICCLEATVGSGREVTRNAWTVWIFPEERRLPKLSGIHAFAYSPTEGDRVPADCAGLELTRIAPAGKNGEWLEQETSRPIGRLAADGSVLVTDTLDDAVRAAAQEGAAVVYLPDDATTSPYKRREAPFWRETAIWLPEGKELGDFPHEGFVDHQFLDMTQRRPFDLGESRSTVKPLVWGVNARHPGLGAYDYVFEASVGKGRILACCLRLGGENNVAGRHLLRCLVQRVSGQDKDPGSRGDAPDAVSGIR